MFRQREKAKFKSKETADIRFDYIKNCIHDYGNQANCPLCKLVVQASKKYFEDEAENNRISRQKSLLSRAQMRINLLTNWSRCQNSFYSDFDSTQKLDIYISKSMADMIIKQNNNGSVLDFSEIIKILSRKNRIKEVGHFACIYLQCRIRKYLAKQFIRLIMIKRFELVPATRTKAAFYVDNFKSHKWTRVPLLLRDEPPGSPRTIDRRIAAETKKKDMRTARFQVALNKCNSHDIFAREFNSVRLLKQFVIFRDLVALAMHRLARNSTNFTNVNSSLASVSNMKSNSENSSFVAPSLINTNINFNGSFLLDTGPQYSPVWVCMSPPASTARQLGLSMALAVMPPIAARNTKDSAALMNSASNETDPQESPATPSGSRKHPSQNTTSANTDAKDKKDGKRVSSVVSVNYNKALQVLESRAWECLKCNTPEEVLAKLMFTDILPGVESVLHISQDEHSIWHGEIDFVKQDNTSHTRLPSVVPTTENPVDASLSAPPIDSTLYRHEVLPMCMQLRPWYADRTANGFFRMFFYEEEFIAASQVSPWAFYPEVLKCRDMVVAALKGFAALPSTKTLVRNYHQQALNAHHKAQAASAGPGGGGEAGRKGSITQISKLTRRGSVTSTRDNNIAAAAANASKIAGMTGGGKQQQGKTKGGGVMNMLTSMNTRDNVIQSSIAASSSLFTPPQELIFEAAPLLEPVKPKTTPKGTVVSSHNHNHSSAASVATVETEDTYSFDHPLDVAALTDLKTIELGHKYSFLSKLNIFADRLKKAVNNTRKKSSAATSLASNIHNRKESNASTINTAGATTVDSNSSVLSLPYLANIHHLHARTSEAHIRDMHAVQGDLVGHEVFHLLLGETVEEANTAAEAGHLHEMGSIAEKSVKSGGRSTKRRGSRDNSKTGSSYGAYEGDSTDDDDDSASLMSGNTQQTTSALPTLSRYAHKLNAYSSLIQTDISSRINIPSAVSGVKSYPYQLMVIDVYVGLPKPNAAAAIAAGGMGPLNRAQKNQGPGTPKYGNFTNANGSYDGATTPNASSRSIDRSDLNSGGGRRGAAPQLNTGSTMNLTDFLVDTHQMVGLFACSSERSPSNLDCGLLDWDYFTQIYRERTQTNPHKLGAPTSVSSLASNASLVSGIGGINSSSASLASGPNAKERMWSPVNPTTGVSIHKTLLPTGREFQLHILAAAPSREHLDKELPKKVKMYLGMPVVSTK